MPSPVTWAALGVLLLGMTGVAAMAVRDSVRLTNPPEYVHPLQPGFTYATDPAKAHGLPFEDVAYASESGGVIRGWLVRGSPQSREVVVAVHGRAGNRTGFLQLAKGMHAAGISTLLLDLRENGLSDGSGRGMSLGMREADDVIVAARGLRQAGFQTVVAAGCSLGGTAVILAAAREPAISGVVAEDALASFPAYVGGLLRKRMQSVWPGLPDAMAVGWGRLVTGISAVRQESPVR